MALTSYVQTAFTGGEISQAAQGRMDLPAYKLSMNVCLNGIPIESGAWLRRPGTRHAAISRGGARGRGIPFAFEQNAPYVMQFTDGFLRFTTGPALVMTNDAQAIVAISTANPAVVQTALPHGWSTGNAVMFNSLGVNNPLLQNRQFTITVTDTTHFSIADAITGTAIDGSTLGAFVSGNVTRILEIATVYTSGSWASIRSVQAEERTVLLNGAHPQVLQVATEPAANTFATFTLGAADFIDGPYLDPIAGSQVSSSALNGVVTLTLSFQAYDSTRAYNIGDFVTSVGQGYKSLTALNQGNTPASSPSNWVAVNAGAPVNSGLGFIASDVGRLIRLFSEPPLWSATASYSAKDVVAYADGSGGYAYYAATAAISGANIGVLPGTSTLWAIATGAAIWTWAQITAVSGSGLIAPVSAVGSMNSLAAAFDGNTTKPFASSANVSQSITTYPAWVSGSYNQAAIVQYNGVAYQAVLNLVTSAPQAFWVSNAVYNIGNQVRYGDLIYVSLSNGNFNKNPTVFSGDWQPIYGVTSTPPVAGAGFWTAIGSMASPTYDNYAGQHYSPSKAVLSARVYPTNDIGFANCPTSPAVTLNLRAKQTAPASASDGTLLGTSGPLSNVTSPVSITSSDSTTAWAYVWIEMLANFVQPLPDGGSHNFTAEMGFAQVQFYAPNVSNGSVITAQIRGNALLYNQTVRTWRLGVYSDTTGWPTCGAYMQGRLFLGGVVSNRFDASVSNGISGVELDFTPTSPDGTVSDNNAISYICNGKQVNQLLWMEQDQQGVLFGTQEGPWLISAPAQGAMSPTNIQAVRVNGPGSANIEPRRAENTLIYVQRFARKVVEAFADVYSGKYTAPNLTERAKHLTVSGIAEIAYQQELAPVIWNRRNDGTLIGATYKRDTLTTSQGPTIIGWHRHALGSGRTVESLCVGPSQNGNLDTPSLVTNDSTTGIRHIELLTDLLDEGFALTDCWFLDDAIVPTSTVVQPATGGPYGSLLVNGLWPHNGKTVTAFIAGLDCGDFTVTNGSITVPFGDGITNGTGAGTGSGFFTAALVASFTTLPAVVGFTYNSDGQLVRAASAADSGSQDGPGFAKLGRARRAAALLYGCVNGSISFGTDFVTLDPAKLYDAGLNPTPPNQLWSGIWRDTINSINDFDTMVTWRISRPLPAFVMAVSPFDNSEGA